MTGHILILACVALMVYGQLVIRWQMRPTGVRKLSSLGRATWLTSGVLATAVRAGLWLVVLTQYEVSYAYPLLSTAFALVVILGVWLLDEELTRGKIIGSTFIIIGVVFVSASN